MKGKLILLIGSIILCTTFSGCISQNIGRNEQVGEKRELEKETGANEGADGEMVQNKEDMPVMSEESIECIEAALGGDSSCAEGIAWYLSHVTDEKIIQAEMIDFEPSWYSYVMKVEDNLGDVYMVMLDADYYVEAIKKDSLDGEWVFYVTE